MASIVSETIEIAGTIENCSGEKVKLVRNSQQKGVQRATLEYNSKSSDTVAEINCGCCYNCYTSASKR